VRTGARPASESVLSQCTYRAIRGRISWTYTPRGIARGVRQSLREIAQERIARELGAAIAPPPYPPSNTIAFIEACLVSQASGRWADVASA
jgi:hypothetical protein